MTSPTYLLALLLGVTSGVQAAESCAIPAGLSPAPVVPQEERRLMAVEKYILAYYWWPQSCRNYPGEGCSQNFGFKVHGLWPDGAGKSYPQFCRAPTALATRTVRANWCMTPSTSLLQHEWAKHGTCNWKSEQAYFGDAQKIAATITMPTLATGKTTAGAVRDAIVRANPKLPRFSLFVGTDRKQWLTEVRVCLDLKYRPVPCEDGDIGAPDRVPVQVWPR